MVQFFFTDVKVSLKDRNRLRLFIKKLFKAEHKKLRHLNYIFCSDEYLLDINRKYLNHDYYTDILTFDLSETKGAITGEIYISIDRVRDNAHVLRQTIKHELHRVIFHGALHLCGYKDKTAKDKKSMTESENRYLKLYLGSQVSRETFHVKP